MSLGEIFDVVKTGGDFAVYVLLWAAWRFDRRVLKLEMIIGRRVDDKGGK